MSAALLQLAVNFVEKLKIYIALHCIATMYRSHGLPVVHVRQQDVASVPVPDLVCQGGCSRKVIIGFQQMIHSPCQPAHPPGVCEGAGHGARADQDDLRRFLQDRSPRVSSVRECEVGCLLQCSVARTTGAETLVLAGLVTRTSVLNTLLSAVNHGSVTRAADDPSVSLRFTFHYAKQALTQW